MQMLEGQPVAERIYTKISSQMKPFLETKKRPPGLAVILVGENSASQVYVSRKIKKCNELGFLSFFRSCSASVSREQLLQVIEQLNQDPAVDGILLQLPLPNHLDANEMMAAISPQKDADGLTRQNIGALFAGYPLVSPCTPAGVIEILNFYDIPVVGRKAVVIGRSQIVGRPMAALLLNHNATVTVVHSATAEPQKICKEADIVVVAAGQPEYFGADYFKKGAVVIDVGIHKINGKIVGDVKALELNHVAALTPVPGGVGPMTIAMLMQNTFQLYSARP